MNVVDVAIRRSSCSSEEPQTTPKVHSSKYQTSLSDEVIIT